MEFIAEDELVEVTPHNIRMRKVILNKEQRMKSSLRAELMDFVILDLEWNGSFSRRRKNMSMKL